jgi:DNA end-binding protein Ku
VSVRPVDGLLHLHTMNFHDEVVDPEELDLPSPQKNPSDREIQMAGKLVDSLSAKFEPSKYKDTYRDAVLKVIKAKAKGEEIAPPEEPEREESDDLAAALEASL